MDTLLDLQGKIVQLQKQAFDLKTRDFDKTVEDIKQTMLVFGITYKDLETPKRSTRPEKPKLGVDSKMLPKVKVSKVIGQPAPVKFRGPYGETWTGRGLKPKWLNSLIAQGATLEDFLVQSSKKQDMTKNAAEAISPEAAEAIMAEKSPDAVAEDSGDSELRAQIAESHGSQEVQESQTSFLEGSPTESSPEKDSESQNKV